jgi:hypothetical protein
MPTRSLTFLRCDQGLGSVVLVGHAIDSCPARSLQIRSGDLLGDFAQFAKSHLYRHFSFARREGAVHKGALRGTDPATMARKPGFTNWRTNQLGLLHVSLRGKTQSLDKKLVDKMPR